MVLIVNGKEINFDNDELKAFLSDYKINSDVYDFHNKKQQNVTNNKNLIYLHQREVATVIQTDPAVCFLGTDDTTTCHFIVLDCLNAGIVSAAHLDGSSIKSYFVNYFSRVDSAMSAYVHGKKITNSHGCEDEENLNIKKHFEVAVHMCGGFIDENDNSKNLSCEILRTLSDCENINFRIALSVITNLNNLVLKGYNYPRHYGAIYNTRIHQMCPAKFSEEAREPYHVLRSTRFCTLPGLFEIYTPETNTLELKDFEYKGGINHQYYRYLSEAPNNVVRRCSTSPRQEKADFEDKARIIYKFMYDYPDPSVFYKTSAKSIRYKCNASTGEWMRTQ